MNEKFSKNVEIKKTPQVISEESFEALESLGIQKDTIIKLGELKAVKETQATLKSFQEELKRSEINQSQKEIITKNIDKVFNKLRENLLLSKKRERHELIKHLEDEKNSEYLVENSKNILESFFPEIFVRLAKNPEIFIHHFNGLVLGASNSIANTTIYILSVGYGIFKSPYDLYLLFSGKGEYQIGNSSKD